MREIIFILSARQGRAFGHALFSAAALAAAQPAFAVAPAENEPFARSEARVLQALALLSTQAAALEEMKACLGENTVSHLKLLDDAFSRAQEGIRQEGAAYKAFVSRPMQGNGRCDGGFQSVSKESARRAARAKAAHDRIQALQDQLNSIFDSQLKNVEWTYDATKNPKCALAADRMSYDISHTFRNEQGAASQALASLAGEKARFVAYQEKNDALAASCGSDDSLAQGTELQKHEAPGKKPPANLQAHGGKQKRPLSNVTGTKFNADKLPAARP